MKKLFVFTLFVCLLAAGAAAADAVTDQLMAEPWESVTGGQLEFKAGGKGTIAGSTPMTYQVSGKTVSYTYAYWNNLTTTQTLYYNEQDGVAFLSAQSSGSIKTAGWFRKSEIADIRSKANKGMQVYIAKFGERIDLGNLVFTLKEVKTVSELSSKNAGLLIVADDNGTPLVFAGTVKNTGKKEIDLTNIQAVLTVGGEEITSSIKIYADTDDSLKNKIPPMGSGKLYIARNLTDRQRANLAGATLTISFMEDLSARPAFLGNGDLIFRWKISAARAETAAVETHDATYFSEASKLPTPTSYLACTQTSSSKTSSNGVVTSITYKYKGLRNEKGSALVNQYASGLKNAGFTLKKSGSAYKVYQKKTLLAEIKADGDLLVVSINPAAGSLKVTYYEESPALAMPTGYVSCRQSGVSSKRTNGKLTSLTYSYSSSMNESGKDMVQQYASGLKKAGYTVKKSGNGYKVSYKNKQLAEIQPNGNKMDVRIVPGNQNFRSHP